MTDTRLHWLLRIAIAAWIVAALAIGARVVLKPQSQTVVPIYLMGAANFQTGEDIYVVYPGLDFYRYSPLFAAVWQPALSWPQPIVGVAWRWFGAAMLLAGMVHWGQRLLPRPLTAVEWGVWLLVCLPIAAASFNNGQANLLMAGMVLFGLAFAADDKPWWSAALLVAAVMVKLYPLAALLLVVAVAPRRFTIPAAVATIVALALPFLFQSPAYVAGQYREWVVHLGGNDRSDQHIANAYRDFMILFRYWAWPLPYRVYQLLQVAAGAGIALLCWRLKQSGRPNTSVYFTMSCLVFGWMTAFGPATESCTYILVAPVFAAAALTARGRTRTLLLSAFGVLFVVPFFGLFPGEWRWQVMGWQPASVLVFMAVTVFEAVTSRPESHISAAPQSLAA